MALLARQAGMALRGDTGLGVTNAYTLQNLASAGFLSATVSFQLTIQQIREMPKPLGHGDPGLRPYPGDGDPNLSAEGQRRALYLRHPGANGRHPRGASGR